MRCYFDETWQTLDSGLRIGVLFGFLIKKENIITLDNFLYQIRKKYYGREHAKDKNSELKGNKLLSNYTFKLANRNPGELPKNHCIVREVISWCQNRPGPDMPLAFASIVYGTDPNLKCMDPKRLEMPFYDICLKISAAAHTVNNEAKVTLIFDERADAQTGIAISIYNFIRGTGIENIDPFPLFSVSNIDPGVQVADIFAFITAKRAANARRFFPWYRKILTLQWKGEIFNGKKRWDFQRYEPRAAGPGYKIRKSW